MKRRKEKKRRRYQEECKDLLASGRYRLEPKQGRHKSEVWDYFKVVVDVSTGKPAGFIQCVNCLSIKIFAKKSSTTSLTKHAKCKPGDWGNTRNVLPLTAQVKSNFGNSIAEWCAVELVPPSVVDADHFKAVVQQAVIMTMAMCILTLSFLAPTLFGKE